MRTGCFIKDLLKKHYIDLLRITRVVSLLTVILCTSVFAQSIINQEKAETYLRWNLMTGRDQLQISKNHDRIEIKTLNNELYSRLREALSKIKLDETYLLKIDFREEISTDGTHSIDVSLKNEKVEMFSFYRERDKKYVIDFWVDSEDTINDRQSSVARAQDITNENIIKEEKEEEPKVIKANSKIVRKLPEEIQNELKEKDTLASGIKQKVITDPLLERLVINPNNVLKKSAEEIEKEEDESKFPYRDFRYGATFVWDYLPIIPSFKKSVDLKIKTPEFFYQIENRDVKKNQKEAHLQLAINLYRKKKWGLMYKSLMLFEDKYGSSTEWELREFIKANAILRENIEVPNNKIFRNALTILSSLLNKSQNYELKKSIRKYLLSYYIEQGEMLNVLQTSKDFYAETRNNFDFEESSLPAEAMFYSLARLGQVDKIVELSEEKTISKILPAQQLLAYKSYVYLKKEMLSETIDLYEKNIKGLARPVDPVLTYNTAEAYFRSGKFKEAYDLFQDFVKNYPYEFVSSHAHLRSAVCLDLLDKNYEEIEALYKKTIDVSVDSEVSYEARIRYVAFRSVRKKKLNESDLEVRVFLDQDKNKPTQDKNILKLLQQVRLRTLIVDKKYREALSYLSLIPTNGMAKIDVRIFEGDGAEIIYGMMADLYKKAEYSELIKAWQTYKNKYVDKVALDPYINFIVGSSYVKLGLYKGFDEVYKSFESLKDTPNRTFPLWVSRNFEIMASELLNEMVIVKDIRLRNWDLVQKNIEKFNSKNKKFNHKMNYYKGIVAFNQKIYPKAISHFEEYLSGEEQRGIYDPSDIADMIRAYTDSIYELGQIDKFLKVSEVLIGDTANFGTDNAYIRNVKERISYLALEIMASKKEIGQMLALERKIANFKKEFSKSVYLGRVDYILGQAMVSNKRIKEGKEIFIRLVNDKETSEYIKELARSELGLINLKEKTL